MLSVTTTSNPAASVLRNNKNRTTVKLRFDLALGRDGNVLFVGDGASADVTRTRTSGGAAAKLSNLN